MTADDGAIADGSITEALGITADDIAPPAEVWDAALAAAFDDTLPSDDSTVPVMGDEPLVPDDDGFDPGLVDDDTRSDTDPSDDAVDADPTVDPDHDQPDDTAFADPDLTSSDVDVDLGDLDAGFDDGAGDL